MHEPLFKSIEFEADIEERTGRFAVAGIVEAKGEPIRNSITGQQQRAKLVLPGGFEFLEAEFASSTTKAKGPPALDWASRHAHFAMINIGPNGPIR